MRKPYPRTSQNTKVHFVVFKGEYNAIHRAVAEKH